MIHTGCRSCEALEIPSFENRIRFVFFCGTSLEFFGVAHAVRLLPLAHGNKFESQEQRLVHRHGRGGSDAKNEEKFRMSFDQGYFTCLCMLRRHSTRDRACAKSAPCFIDCSAASYASGNSPKPMWAVETGPSDTSGVPSTAAIDTLNSTLHASVGFCQPLPWVTVLIFMILPLSPPGVRSSSCSSYHKAAHGNKKCMQI